MDAVFQQVVWASNYQDKIAQQEVIKSVSKIVSAGVK